MTSFTYILFLLLASFLYSTIIKSALEIRNKTTKTRWKLVKKLIVNNTSLTKICTTYIHLSENNFHISPHLQIWIKINIITKMKNKKRNSFFWKYQRTIQTKDFFSQEKEIFFSSCFVLSACICEIFYLYISGVVVCLQTFHFFSFQ